MRRSRSQDSAGLPLVAEQVKHARLLVEADSAKTHGSALPAAPRVRARGTGSAKTRRGGPSDVSTGRAGCQWSIANFRRLGIRLKIQQRTFQVAIRAVFKIPSTQS